jgi:hypothetical protein
MSVTACPLTHHAKYFDRSFWELCSDDDHSILAFHSLPLSESQWQPAVSFVHAGNQKERQAVRSMPYTRQIVPRVHFAALCCFALWPRGQVRAVRNLHGLNEASQCATKKVVARSTGGGIQGLCHVAANRNCDRGTSSFYVGRGCPCASNVCQKQRGCIMRRQGQQFRIGDQWR